MRTPAAAVLADMAQVLGEIVTALPTATARPDREQADKIRARSRAVHARLSEAERSLQAFRPASSVTSDAYRCKDDPCRAVSDPDRNDGRCLRCGQDFDSMVQDEETTRSSRTPRRRPTPPDDVPSHLRQVWERLHSAGELIAALQGHVADAEAYLATPPAERARVRVQVDPSLLDPSRPSREQLDHDDRIEGRDDRGRYFWRGPLDPVGAEVALLNRSTPRERSDLSRALDAIGSARRALNNLAADVAALTTQEVNAA
jgi:hypothetical protein